ncbi:MAG: TIGR04219 family outer membrane beta-barrel protein [Gammaproteobacteria bacterium]|nr:TIGR04219 family outer membrane beta-barrel protein [Gammaproteobacteria bacterium]
MINKKIVLATAIASVMSLPVYADAIGVYVGAQAWQSEAKGGFAESNDLVNFSFDEQTKASAYIKIEHPVPLIPNLRLRMGTLEGPGRVSLTSDFTFGDKNYLAGKELETSLDFTNTDITLYWEILDNDLVGLDFGLTAKYLSGEFSVTGDVDAQGVKGTSYEDASLWIPMAYVAAKIAIPMTGVFVYGDVNLVSYSDNSIHDYEVGVGYNFVDNFAVDIAVTAGYREVSIEIEDVDDIYANLQFEGYFAGIEVHF